MSHWLNLSHAWGRLQTTGPYWLYRMIQYRYTVLAPKVDITMKKFDSTSKLVVVLIMRPSSLGGGRILRRTLSVCPSVPLSLPSVTSTVEPSYERTSKIETLLFSLMGQRHVCTFRHALRAAYRTAISAAQILVFISFDFISTNSFKLHTKTCLSSTEVTNNYFFTK